MAETVIRAAKRVIGPTRRLSRGWRALLALVAIAAIGVGVMQTVQAVHDTDAFELEGNPNNDVAAVTHDWEDVYADELGDTLVNSDAVAVSWVDDGDLNATIFTGGGSKDIYDLNQWAWKDGAGGLPDKDNLLHSFAAQYALEATNGGNCSNGTGGTTGIPFDPNKKCVMLYFGSDRFDNSGDAHQAFWFFQKTVTLGDNKIGGGQGFVDQNGDPAQHTLGDLLIISNFSNGGTTSNIVIYAWDPSAPNNLKLLSPAAPPPGGVNCLTIADNDSQFCGVVNPDNGTTTPWASSYTDKSGNNTYLQGEFYEGGINLSVFDLADSCFSSVASETRSSTSTTATLKDFVLGSFADCDTSLVTTPANSTGTPIPAAGISIGSGSIQVRDNAVLTVNGVQDWTGKVKFFLCGPTFGTAYVLCETGGTQIGAAAGESVADPSPVTLNSALATITSAGRYCWRADFVADNGAGIPPASDFTETECFTVNPAGPAMITSATTSVQIGNPITDTATLSLTAAQPGTPVINPTVAGAPAGGSITFRLYGPSTSNLCDATNLVYTSSAITVSGNNTYGGFGGGVTYTPTAAGTYRWIATYTGSAPNTSGPISGGCGDSTEISVVTPKQPTISTVATAGPVPVGTALDDTATLGGTSVKPNGNPATGTITFTLYGPVNLALPVADRCTPAIATRVVNVSGNGNYTASSGTGSGSLTPTAAGTYYWIAAYSGDLPNTLSVSGACGDTNEASIIIKLQPSISTAQTFTVKDSATITVAGGAGNLAGSVLFELFNNAGCNPGAGNVDRLYSSGPIAVSGASPQTVESGTTTITTSKPVLSWRVTYTSTNAGHHNVTHTCNIENSSLTITNGGSSNTP